MMRLQRLTQLLLVILCCLSCVIILRNWRARLVVTFHAYPQVNELNRIIHDQREKIRYLSAHPRVIFRCPEDGPIHEYPSHASDDLTEIVMSTSDECEEASKMDAVIIVHSAVTHFKRRQQYRNLYGNYSNTRPYRLKIVFLIGSVLNASLDLRLESENRDYGDTVVGSFLDTYHNLTLKAVMGFRWLANTCADIKLLIKMDDDVFFDVRKFFNTYWTRVSDDMKKKALHCIVWSRAPVGRAGKWKVHEDIFAGPTYNFSYCAGFFVVVSPDLITPFYNQGRNVKFFWIDDVFLYGIVPASIGGVQFFQTVSQKRMLVENYDALLSCREDHGPDKCSIWAALISKDEDFDYEYSTLLSPEQDT